MAVEGLYFESVKSIYSFFPFEDYLVIIYAICLLSRLLLLLL